MFDTLDPVLLARIQFAFTISFHIIFPAFTIGLASWLAVLEWRWLKTGNVMSMPKSIACGSRFSQLLSGWALFPGLSCLSSSGPTGRSSPINPATF